MNTFQPNLGSILANYIIISLWVFSLPINVNAQLPTHSHFELQIRSNIKDGFGLPPLSTFYNSTAVLNDRRQVAIDLNAINGETVGGIWMGQHAKGEIIYQTKPELFISDLSLNQKGMLLFDQASRDFYSTGLYLFDYHTKKVDLVVDPSDSFNARFFQGIQIGDSNIISFRVENYQRQKAYIRGYIETQLNSLAVDNGHTASSPYSYLFAPKMNDKGDLVAKVRYGKANSLDDSNPDAIIVWWKNKTQQIIMQDNDMDKNSPIAKFDNSPSIADNGFIAFTVTMIDQNRAIYLYNGIQTSIIASTNDSQITTIDFFPPVVNKQGWVAFRGRDENSLQTIFISDGNIIKKIISEHDLIETDLGQARIDQESDHVPVFSGGIDLNNHGDLSFQCGLTPPDNNQIEWGSGLFVVVAQPE